MRPSRPSAGRLLCLAICISLGVLLTGGEARAQMSDDHSNFLGNAAALLTPGVPVTGVLENADDVDVFRFQSALAAQDVWVYTNGLTDTVGQLYDSTGAPIAANDDSVLANTPHNFFIGRTLSPGTYYIGVFSTGALGSAQPSTGPYSIHLRLGADQGRTLGTEAPLPLDTDIDGIIGSAGDRDLFKIDLSTKADVVIYTSGNIDTIGELLDYRGVRLESSNDSDISEGAFDFFIGRTLAPGVYYIAVSSFGGETGPYRLHTRIVADQGDICTNAADLLLDSSEIGLIDSYNDKDCFRLDLSAATDVWIYTSGSLDTVGELLDRNGNPIAENDDSVGSQGLHNFFIAKSLAPGVYYIAVSGYGGKTGPYRVYAQSTADQGDTVVTAEELTLGTPVIGLIDPGDDADLFKLDLSGATATTEVFIYNYGGVDTVGELFDSDGTTLLGADDNSGYYLNFFIRRELEPGVYYIRVSSYRSEIGPYAVFAEPVTPFTLGTVQEGAITKGYDEEYYKLELSGPTDVWIYAAGPLDTVGVLYDSNLTPIAFSDDSGVVGRRTAFHFRETLDAGTYYINLGSFETGTGNYTLHDQTVTDPGGSTGAASRLTLGSPTPGTIHPATDADYFRLDFTRNTNLLLYAKSVTLSPILGNVLDRNGNKLRVNEYSRDDGFVIRDDFGPGTYYVKVTAAHDSSDPLTAPVNYTIHAFEDSTYTDFIEGCQGTTGDPLYLCQWHLQNQERDQADINVEPVWAEGINGEGVNIAVVDDGMDFNHEDLTANVDTTRNHDYTGRGSIHHPFEHHGTYVSGVIAARDNNNIGGRGVAPRATIYGHNFLADQTYFSLADAMTRNQVVTAVSNNSWGPTDGPGIGFSPRLWEAAVETGTREGYGGKGTLYVFAAGSSHEEGDNVNLNEFANYYAVTAVCAVNDKDIRSDYSEVGAPLWVCAPSSDRRADYRSIVTTENSDRYSNTFGGTSASASIVSGVAALMRHANPELTWRDLKLILAASARKNDPENTGWEDGARRYESDSATEVYSFNHEYGFGVVDAKAAIDLARNWSNFPPLPPMKSERAASGSINTPIPEAPSFGNPGTVTSKLTLNTGIRFTEFVEIRASFRRTSLRDLDIELVSPSGAVSKLAEPYYTIDGVPLSGEIRFGSAKHLGEDPNGQWTLRMTDRIRFGTGTLDSWSIKVYGHEPPAVTLNTAPVFSDSEGNLITETVRSVAENTAEGQNIGDSVAATDAEDDTLTYTLGGADADSFDIDASTGQLKTKATLNFEAQASYSVDVTATDPSGASAAIMVTIMVTDVTTGSALGDRYDADENGVITKDEAIAAVVDYFNGDITKEETIRVITLYFSSY